MTPVVSRRGDNRAPALAGAVALHLTVLILLLWTPFAPPLGGQAVPITIVAHAPGTGERAAQEADKVQHAATPTPVPAAPAPQPPPAPAKPQPRPQPSPKPLPPAPHALARPTPQPTTRAQPRYDSFSLDALAADVSHARHAQPPRPASAARGPQQAETALQARPDAGQGVSASDVAGLSSLLNRLWNKNCSLDETVVVPVTFTVGLDGRLIGRPNAGGRENSANPSVAVATRRALDAIGQAEPYALVYRGKTFKVIFDAKKACANE
ncbi:MAG: hypothetical protein KGL69_06210 [Alphaproteobacteria bacterium]|nr:hypothetical protein [Alphaproteobacteria bacterium]